MERFILDSNYEKLTVIDSDVLITILKFKLKHVVDDDVIDITVENVEKIFCFYLNGKVFPESKHPHLFDGVPVSHKVGMEGLSVLYSSRSDQQTSSLLQQHPHPLVVLVLRVSISHGLEKLQDGRLVHIAVILKATAREYLLPDIPIKIDSVEINIES